MDGMDTCTVVADTSHTHIQIVTKMQSLLCNLPAVTQQRQTD
jgi:hypothetical protein